MNLLIVFLTKLDSFIANGVLSRVPLANVFLILSYTLCVLVELGERLFF